MYKKKEEEMCGSKKSMSWIFWEAKNEALYLYDYDTRQRKLETRIKQILPQFSFLPSSFLQIICTFSCILGFAYIEKEKHMGINGKG